MAIDKEALRKENTIRFIEAAKELIKESGIENISIRKIAEKAGFHNSTLYLYFKDADELIMLASLEHFAEYSNALAHLSSKHWDANENFYFIWRFFAESMFKEPNIFYNYFFGKYGDSFGDILKHYYELFPEQTASLSPEIEDMFLAKNLEVRCLKLLKTIESLDNRITPDNLNMINELILSYVKYTLSQKCQNPELDSDILTNEFMETLKFVIEH